MARKRRNSRSSAPVPHNGSGNSAAAIQRIRAEFSGPLPPPGLLAQYDEVVPGAAERMLKMAESQSAHRQSMESITVKGDSHRSWAGLVFGGIVALTGFAAAAYLAYLGYAWQGVWVGGLDITGIVGVFVYGSQTRRQERELKFGSRPRR